MKKLALVCALALIAAAAPVAQAQTFSGFTANNDGAEFWDNPSDDGLNLQVNNCNSGYVVTGAAPSTCINQRPDTWLPYTDAPATTYWNIGGDWAPIIFANGVYTFEFLGGTPSSGCAAPCTGGDIAGANLDWGIFDIGNRSIFESFNGGGSYTPPFSSAVSASSGFWGIYVDLLGGGRAYSDTDRQFALFGYRAPGDYIAGIEDNAAGDWDYQDMMFRIIAEDGGTPEEVVPEPATMTLLATGLVGLAASRRRKNQK